MRKCAISKGKKNLFDTHGFISSQLQSKTNVVTITYNRLNSNNNSGFVEYIPGCIRIICCNHLDSE